MCWKEKDRGSLGGLRTIVYICEVLWLGGECVNHKEEVDIVSIILLIVGIVVGIAIGYLLCARQSSSLRVSLETHDERLAELTKGYEARLADEQKRGAQIRREVEENGRREMAERERLLERGFQERLQEVRQSANESMRQMRSEFSELSHRLLKEQSEQMTQDNAARMGQLLTPFSLKLNALKEQVEKAHEHDSQARAGLMEHLKILQSMNSRLSEEASNLSRALRSEAKTQGNWGEMILEQILSASGLERGVHYFTQEILRDEKGGACYNDDTDKRMQPDVIVRYPNDRDVIIDSKVTLVAYVNYTAAASEEERRQAMQAHLRSVRTHVDELAQKDYSRYDTKSPDFVMMFVPNEGALLLAMNADPQLWMYAYDKKVVLLSPTNLISALRLALDLWNREKQLDNVNEIIKQGNRLFDKAVVFSETFRKLGDRVKQMGDEYDKALGQLLDGRGALVKQAEKMRSLGLTTSKRFSRELLPNVEEDGEDGDD